MPTFEGLAPFERMLKECYLKLRDKNDKHEQSNMAQITGQHDLPTWLSLDKSLNLTWYEQVDKAHLNASTIYVTKKTIKQKTTSIVNVTDMNNITNTINKIIMTNISNIVNMTIMTNLTVMTNTTSMNNMTNMTNMTNTTNRIIMKALTCK